MPADEPPRFTIGGSQAAAAVGLDPYKSPVALWAELTGLTEPREAGEAALWGQLLEPLIVAQVEARDYAVLPAPAEGLTGPEPWMTAHPDGYCTTNGGSRGILEVKTAGSWVKGWEDDGVPPAYIAQVHHYMHATQLDWALIACLIGGQKLELRTVNRDDALLAMILEAEAEFVGYCQRNEPPSPDGSDATTEVLRRLYPRASEGETVALTAADMLHVGELRALKAAAKETAEQMARHENYLKLRMGHAELADYEGAVVVRWPTVEQNMPAKDAYQKSYRRFSLA